MMTYCKYIVINSNTTEAFLDVFTNILMNGGEIVSSWTTQDSVHHLIKWDANDEKYGTSRFRV